MTRAELRAALLAYGHQYLDTQTVNRFIDEAAAEVTEEELWHERESTNTADCPFDVAGLGPLIQALSSIGIPLQLVDQAWLEARYRDLGLAGEPRYVYFSGGNTVSTYPVGSDVTVRHYCTCAWLGGAEVAESDTDEPVIPVRFHSVILLKARIKAKEDSDDEAEAQALEVRYEGQLEKMRNALLPMPQRVEEPA